MQAPVEKERCTGCWACANGCPAGCISMEPDEEGFLYPKIDAAACTDCGLCRRVCPAARSVPVEGDVPKAYALHALDRELLEGSASGGGSALLAQRMLERGGVVFGAVFDEAFLVYHGRIENMAELERFQGSKYPQSAVGDVYRQTKALLERGTPVLFTGTPCQIAGLRAYLARDYEGLLCQDLICHSVPSPRVWRAYLSELERAHGGRAASVCFRHKAEGWTRYQFRVEFTDGEAAVMPGKDNPYMQAFLGGLICRPSCHQCPFKGLSRPSDITLADFWGVKQICREALERQGTTLALVHTEKGAAALEALRERAAVTEVDPVAAVTYNRAVLRPSPAAPRRKMFWRAYRGNGLEEIARRCLEPTLSQRVKTAAGGNPLLRAGGKCLHLLRKE